MKGTVAEPAGIVTMTGQKMPTHSKGASEKDAVTGGKHGGNDSRGRSQQIVGKTGVDLGHWRHQRELTSGRMAA